MQLSIMKNNYKFYAFLLAIPVAAFMFLGYSSGQTAPYSGSPGDNGNTCAVCHSGSANYNAIPTITTNIPVTGYEVNHTYTITVSVTSNVTRHGFQLTAEKTGGIKVGEFTAGTGSQVTNSTHHAVTHTYAGNSQTAWSFSWTAPATNEGEITFYAAVNATNSNNSDSGDQVVTTNVSVSHSTVGLADFNTLKFEIYPNPTVDFIQIYASDTYEKNAHLSISNTQGQLILKQSLDSNTRVDVSELSSGVYFVQLVSGNKLGTAKFIKE